MSKAITIVGLGDSITAAKAMADEEKRWLRVLEAKLCTAFPSIAFKVVNAGAGGNSAREAMARLDRDVLAHSPDFVILQFGGNNNDPGRPERRVPPDEFNALLARFRDSLPPQTRGVVVTFPPVYRHSHAYWKNPDYRDYLLESERRGMGLADYVRMTREFAQANGYPMYDCHAELTALAERDGWQTYTRPDGVHLTAAGNRALAAGVFGVLEPLIAAEVEQ